jgi:hypothetical protein
MADNNRIQAAESWSTGGGIWSFGGQMDDGRYFLACDLEYDVMFTDADPRDTDECFEYEWQQEHKTSEMQSGSGEATEFFKDLGEWLKKNKPDCGYDFTRLPE